MRGATKILSNISNSSKVNPHKPEKKALKTSQLHSSKDTKNEHGIQNSQSGGERKKKGERQAPSVAGYVPLDGYGQMTLP